MGHRWPDIEDYTLAQIKQFSKGAVSFYGMQRASQLQLTALGAQGKGEDIEKTIKSLIRGK